MSFMLYSYSPAEDRATLESDLSADRGARCRGRAASSALFAAPAEAPKAINSGGLGAGPQFFSLWLPRIPEVYLANAVLAEIDLPLAIGDGGPECHCLAPEGLAHPETSVAKSYLADYRDLAHQVAGTIFSRWQPLWKAAGAVPVAAGGHCHPQGFVGPLQIIGQAPGIEAGLTVDQFPPLAVLQEF